VRGPLDAAFFPAGALLGETVRVDFAVGDVAIAVIL
jgi:hypothetical protein